MSGMLLNCGFGRQAVTRHALERGEELAMCSPAMRELEEGAAEDMAGYMEERV